jgi:hypothetical protein
MEMTCTRHSYQPIYCLFASNFLQLSSASRALAALKIPCPSPTAAFYQQLALMHVHKKPFISINFHSPDASELFRGRH